MSRNVASEEIVTPQIVFNTNPSDFNNWTNGAGNGGDPFTKTISGDGLSVTITRNTPDSAVNGRFYIQFNFGPWANVGDRISIRFRVSGFDGGAGSPTDHVYAQNTNIVAPSGEAVRKTVTADGDYGLIVETSVANLINFPLRVGVGTFTNDASTNSITISDVQVTRAYQGQTDPDPLVRYKYPQDAVNVITGDIIRNRSITYTAATGVISAESHNTVTGRSNSIGLAMGDSFFASSGSTYGGMLYRLSRYYKNLVLYYNATGGRSLEDMSVAATFLDPLWAEDGATRASFLLVNGGINDLINNARTDTNLIAYDQLIYDWCVARNLYYVKFGIAPFGAHVSWSSTLQGYTDSYNAALAANPFGSKFIYIPIYSAMEDVTTADNLSSSYNGGDGLHPSYASSFATHAGVDEMIKQASSALSAVASTSTSLGLIGSMIGSI